MEQDTLTYTNTMGLLMLLAKEFIRLFKTKTENHDESILNHTVAVTKLTVQVEHLTEKINETIPELKSDIQEIRKRLMTLRQDKHYDRT